MGMPQSASNIAQLSRIIRSTLVVALVCSAGIVLNATPAFAASITVDTTVDEFGTGTSCSLREAIQAANTDTAFGGCVAGSGVDTIVLVAGATYTLTSTVVLADGLNGTPSITSTISISGNGATITRNSGVNNMRLIRGSSGNLTLQNLTLSNGLARGLDGGAGGAGGGGGAAGLGGAIYNRGTVTLNGVTLTGNQAIGGNGGNGGSSSNSNGGGGGGVQSSGTVYAGGAPNGGVSLGLSATGEGGGGAGGSGAGGTGGFGGGGGGGGTNSNSAGGAGGFGAGGGGGGGVASGGAGGGSSLFGASGGAGASNRGGGGGGGMGAGGAIFNRGTLNITNSTLSGNTASGGNGGTSGGGSSSAGSAGAGYGGALFNYDGGSVTIDQTTIVSNTAANGGGGIYSYRTGATTTLILRTSIVANSTSGFDCVVNGAHNTSGSTSNLIESNSSCPSATVTADPALGSLADNGGSTFTFLPASGSAAINAVISCTISVDQRGISRPQGSACDIGAVEVQVATNLVVINNSPTQLGTQRPLRLQSAPANLR